jgi:hypothetical protein
MEKRRVNMGTNRNEECIGFGQNLHGFLIKLLFISSIGQFNQKGNKEL